MISHATSNQTSQLGSDFAPPEPSRSRETAYFGCGWNPLWALALCWLLVAGRLLLWWD